MKKVMKMYLVILLAFTIAGIAVVGVNNYANFRRTGCRIDFNDPWYLGDETYYFGKLITADGAIIECLKTEKEWSEIIYNRLK